MAQNYRKTLTKHRQAKKGRGLAKLERIKMDCIRVNLKNVGPVHLFSNLRYVRMMYQNVIYTAGKSFSVVMWP